jgi:hypothetical protein
LDGLIRSVVFGPVWCVSDPRHRWTDRTGHMGNTFRLRQRQAGGANALEGVFGRGRTPAFRGPGRRDHVKIWCRRRDLNPRPTHYECVALPLSYCGFSQFHRIYKLSLQHYKRLTRPPRTATLTEMVKNRQGMRTAGPNLRRCVPYSRRVRRVRLPVIRPRA